MKKRLAHLALFSLVAAALVAVPASSRAQETNTPSPKRQTPPAAPNNLRQPFGGIVSNVNGVAMTLTVSTMTISVNSQTKIYKDGKPATFTDITVGDMANGSYKKDSGGTLNAISIRLGEAGDKKDMKKAGISDQPAVIPNGS